MRELQPVNQNVLLELPDTKSEQTTASGIIIPDTVDKLPGQLGERLPRGGTVARRGWARPLLLAISRLPTVCSSPSQGVRESTGKVTMKKTYVLFAVLFLPAAYFMLVPWLLGHGR